MRARPVFGNERQSAIVSHIDITLSKKTEEDLRESEARLRRITDNMMDMICQIDSSGVFEYISPSYKNVLGYEPQCLIGKSFYDLVHPEDLKYVVDTVQTISRDMHKRKFEYRYLHANGSYIWLESVSNYLSKDNGLIQGDIISSRDITERKNAENI